MKLILAHRQHIKNEIDKILASYPNIATEYEVGQFNNSLAVKDLQTRFCSDLLYKAGLPSWICDNVYSYVDDTHIFSFLKTICPQVTKKY